MTKKTKGEIKMKNIMTRAWEIAKEGQNKFGGKAVDYLSESLKMAWSEWNNLKENVEQLKVLNEESVKITRKPMTNLDFDSILEKAKNETGERYNRALNNITVLVSHMSKKLDNIKLRRNIA